ncbi:phage tail protein [Pseudomonas sp. KCA11]|nr:phage tail protein [Pseudomonas sp. KCA11]MCE5994897.1 phage tail protein [Pseudomonas sp. KCA11]
MFSSASIRPKEDPPKEAIKAFPHLLILQPQSVKAEPFYFNLDTAAFEELRRKTSFRWAAQERLTRRSAQQAVGIEVLLFFPAALPACAGFRPAGA